VYVLDDVMSALDAHVGKEMFDNCILGTLAARGKTVLLVTNQLQVCLYSLHVCVPNSCVFVAIARQYLPKCGQVVFMGDQTVSESGTFAELMALDRGFASLYKAHTANEDDAQQVFAWILCADLQ
jgi:ATP-binding cassette subfamily C (CFTR/MRP) protein 1